MDLAALLKQIVDEHAEQINDSPVAQDGHGWIDVSVRVDLNLRMGRVVPVITIKPRNGPAHSLDLAA